MTTTEIKIENGSININGVTITFASAIISTAPPVVAPTKKEAKAEVKGKSKKGTVIPMITEAIIAYLKKNDIGAAANIIKEVSLLNPEFTPAKIRTALAQEKAKGVFEQPAAGVYKLAKK